MFLFEIKLNDTVSGSNIGNNKKYTITLYKDPEQPQPIMVKKETKNKEQKPNEILQSKSTPVKNDKPSPIAKSTPSTVASKKEKGDIKSDKNLTLVKGVEKEGLGGSVERSPEYIESILIYLQRYRYYPPLALKRHMTGTVKVTLVISCDGSLKNYEIISSSGKDILDESVKSMLAKTNDFPTNSSCTNPITVTVPIEFRMA
jgi:protein TonB